MATMHCWLSSLIRPSCCSRLSIVGVGDRAFPVVAGRTWNSHTLSQHVTSAPSLYQSSEHFWRPTSARYRQHCVQRKPPVLNFLRGRFWGFSPRSGDTLHRWGEFWHVSYSMPNFTPSVQRQGYRTQKNWNFYVDLTKMWNINAQQGRIPWEISTKFAAFVPHVRLR